jgi:hypothetical protein
LTPTGLTPDDLIDLTETELEALAAWHVAHAGDDEGRPWWPASVRRLSVDSRLQLAQDEQANAAWEQLERIRVAESFPYFLEGYGHVQPEEGPPVPFEPWDVQPHLGDGWVGARSQAELVGILDRELRVIILKTRQIGATWAALHEAVWMKFNPDTPNARCLALSKRGDDATKLVGRVRRIIRLLPDFLRPVEDHATKMAAQRIQLLGGWSIVSLPASPSAARMETASWVLIDEGAFVLNKGFGPTWTAVQPTIGRRGRIRVVSTGNGPEEAIGDGQRFAQLWSQARAGDEDVSLVPVFLPSSSHPARDELWRRRERKAYLTDEEFEAEYPESEDEALQGVGGIKVFSAAGLARAVELGKMYDELLWSGQLEPSGGMAAMGVDHGEMTGMVPIWPLEDGGIYVPPGELYGGGHVGMTVRDSTDAFMEGIAPWQAPGDGVPAIKLEELRFDAAGIESHRVMLDRIEELDMERWDWVLRYKPQLRQRVKSCRTDAVSFNKWKTFTYDYLRWLVKRTAAGETTRVFAVSPENPVLLRQMRGLELMEDLSGRIAKGEDHLPDALMAGARRIARANVSAMPKRKQGADEPVREMAA